MTLRDVSKANYTATTPPNWEQINAGSLQRIADALEVVSKRYNDLLAETERWKQWHDAEQDRRAAAERKISALRGVVTRLKKRTEATRG